MNTDYDGYKYDKSMQPCIMYAKMIKQYDPDPFYVKYVFARYLDEAERAINGIFSDANIDFGLGIRRKVITRDTFEDTIQQRDKQKKSMHAADRLASEFLRWYDIQYAKRWHTGTLARMMGIIRHTKSITGHIPEIKVMITSKHKYRDDPTYEIDVSGITHNSRLRSRKALDAHTQRGMPVFLEILNYKRHQKGEMIASAKHTMVSTFAVIYDNHKQDKGHADANSNHKNINDGILYPAARHMLLSHLKQARAIPQQHTLSYTMPIADAVQAYTHTIATIKSESASHTRKIISDAVASAISFTRKGRT